MHRVLSVLVIGLWVGALVMGNAAAAEMKHQREHAMSGTVTDIDPQTGKLSLSTEAGDLELHFPPSALKGVKEGDSLTVYLSFSKGGRDECQPTETASLKHRSIIFPPVFRILTDHIRHSPRRIALQGLAGNPSPLL